MIYLSVRRSRVSVTISVGQQYGMKLLYGAIIITGLGVVTFMSYPRVSRLKPRLAAVYMRSDPEEIGNLVTSVTSDSEYSKLTDVKRALVEYSELVQTQRLGWVKLLNASQLYKETISYTQTKLMSNIMQICSEAPRTHGWYVGKSQIVQFRGVNVTYTLVPKTGSTNLLRKFCILIGKDCSQRIGSKNEHSFMIYSKRYVDPVEQLEMYSSHNLSATNQGQGNFLFTVVRNPWQRLVSTYIQKFLLSTQYKGQCANIWLEFDEMKIANHSHWSFRDYLEKCVLSQFDKGGITQMNEHWRPQFICSAVCDLKYNYIAKLENFSTEELVILKAFNQSADNKKVDKIAYRYRRPNEKFNTTNKSYGQYWRTIETSLINRLRQLYYFDFKIFDYPNDPFL